MENYLATTKKIYEKAAIHPDKGLCCTTTPIWQLPGLSIPKKMLEMNYGCGSTVHPGDLTGNPTILYVGVGGGMELLQFSYFSRKRNAVIGVDAVDEMLKVCEENLEIAAEENPWFNRDMVDLRCGDALNLTVENESVDIAAQNCLFNIFKEYDLIQALSEMYRVLRPHGKLILSDPVSESIIPDNLKNDENLRALCLSGAMPLKDYLALISKVGFGTIEIRAKRPYRILDPGHYGTDSIIVIESVEICAIKDPIPADGPCIFTGRTAIYFGNEEYFDDRCGHVIMNNRPLSVCDKTAKKLEKLNRSDIYISPSTWFYDGGGCC